MRLIDDEIIKKAAISYAELLNRCSTQSAIEHSFQSGCVWFENNVLPLIIKFAEWISLSEFYYIPSSDGWIRVNDTNIYKTIDMFNIFIEEQNKQNSNE